MQSPPLAADSASIHRKGGSTRAVTQQFVGLAQAGPRLGVVMSQGFAVLNVLSHKPFTTGGFQSGIGMGMNKLGGQWISDDTRTMTTSNPLVS